MQRLVAPTLVFVVLLPGAAPAQRELRCLLPHIRLVDVQDGSQLAAALAAARPGDLIRMKPGDYFGRFEARASGTEDAPITVCGPPEAVLDAGSVTGGYGLHVTGSHWIFTRFTVANAKKGVVLDGANSNLFAGLEVRDIGEEGVRFRAFSSDNILRGSYIHHTGREGHPHDGEGVTIGTDHSQWCEHSSCLPDRSDRNQIVANVIEMTPAECIDVKEGTTGGTISDNVLSGAGMISPDGADSWIDVKGNGYLIDHNQGEDSPRDGFQVHVEVDGWGRGNHFTRNVAEVSGPGLAFKIAGQDNVVECNNAIEGARRGLANVACGAGSPESGTTSVAAGPPNRQ